jgi:hypothetical protein
VGEWFVLFPRASPVVPEEQHFSADGMKSRSRRIRAEMREGFDDLGSRVMRLEGFEA